MSVSKIRGHRDDIFTCFLTSSFIAIYKQTQLRCFMTGRRPSCNKASVALQQGPYGVATSAPLHCRKAVVATPGGPYGSEAVAFQDKIKGLKITGICVLEKP